MFFSVGFAYLTLRAEVFFSVFILGNYTNPLDSYPKEKKKSEL